MPADKVNDADRAQADEAAQTIHAFMHVFHADEQRRAAAICLNHVFAAHRLAAERATVERIVKWLKGKASLIDMNKAITNDQTAALWRRIAEELEREGSQP